MSDEAVKLSYNSNLLRVRIEFSVQAAEKSQGPPHQEIERAKQKMEQEKSKNTVAYYEFYADKFTQFWQRVGSIASKIPDKNVAFGFDIASGTPEIQGIIVKRHPEGAGCLVSFQAPVSVIAKWPISFVTVIVRRELKKLGIQTAINEAQLHGALVRASMGQVIKDLHIGPLPAMQTGGKEKPFSILGSKARNEIAVIINDSNALSNKHNLEIIVMAAQDAIKKLSQTIGQEIKFLKNELVLTLKVAAAGPERLGLNLPLVALAGTTFVKQGDEKAVSVKSPAQLKVVPKVAPQTPTSQKPKQPTGQIAKAQQTPPPPKQQAQPETEKPNQAATSAPTAASTPTILKPGQMPVLPPEVNADYPGKGKLPIKISDDKLEAYIEEIEPKTLYGDPKFELSEEWFRKELMRGLVFYGVKDGLFAKAMQAFQKKENPSGMLVAQGQTPAGGKKPYLHHSYKDVQNVSSPEGFNIRDRGQRLVVQAGKLIAEVHYEVPSVVGISIHGVEIPPLDDEPFNVNVGENVEQKDGNKFFSKVDGMPVIQDNNVSVNQFLVINGDVNLRSGDIIFTGPLEVKGSIDSGATVQISGDLLVHGTIRDAYVKCGGNVEVKGGIVTADHGRVRSRGDIQAEFIENSHVVTGGNLLVKKVILNSQVVVGGYIHVNETSGVVAGGMISCKQYLKTAKLGFPNGAVTTVKAGVDWRIEMAVQIREKRLQKMEQLNQNDRNALRELVKKKGTQKTQRHAEMMEKLQKRVTREREIIEKMIRHLESVKTMLNYDPEARIYVHDTLTSNVQLSVGGVTIPVAKDVAGVEILSKRRKGSFIVPLNDGKEGEKKKAS